MEKTYKYNAVFNGKHYDHFGIHPKLGSLYGDKPEDIVEVELKICDDQNIPISSDNKNMIFDYWGWFDYDKQSFTMIYPKRFLLEMCFPYGIKASEDKNQGKAYRLEIVDKK
jgi:hypothetical protein